MSRIRENGIAFITIVRKEIMRFCRIWVQTIIPPAITMTLYFVIFGRLIGSQVAPINGYSYMQFIAPGLIMMSVVTNAYANVVSSFYGARFQRNIEELLVSPTPNSLILLGFVCGGLARGLAVGGVVTGIALLFTHLHLHNAFLVFSTTLLTGLLFSLAGFTNALFAKTFDDITIVPTFILTPLTYLGGVFYSIHALSPFWQHLSEFNPVLYIVNIFRYGVLGVSDVNVSIAFTIILFFVVALFSINLYLLNKGIGIRN